MSTDREEFDEFVRQHREALVRYALVLCRDPHFAQDLVQETFLRMWRARKASNDATELNRSFARTILKNILIDHLRRRGKEIELFRKAGETATAILPEYPSDRSAARERIRRFLEKLSEPLQEIFFLNVVAGFKPREIAEFVGLKPATVSNYLSGVRKLIKTEHPDLDDDNS
jgi:RNA polymerase sigma-70 factor, ECF subfamily